MKTYTITPESGHPYTNIRTDLGHVAVGSPSIAQRGEVLLNVLHNNGMIASLPFYHTEIKEIK